MYTDRCKLFDTKILEKQMSPLSVLLALFPADFIPQLRDKIWEWPGDKVMCLYSLGPRPKPNPSADDFQYLQAIHAPDEVWG